MHNCYGFEARKQWRPAGKGQKLSRIRRPEKRGFIPPEYSGDHLMPTAYVNGQVIDGRGNAYQGYVIVDGDKIAEVGRGNPASLGEGSPLFRGSSTVTSICAATAWPIRAPSKPAIPMRSR